ncbi:sugar phosphate isomerase/epimerase family protein [Pedosphaera parvula]|uniref:Xylose isomerase domain protein TIM barrel n=1 Tax=Pedosphaera parvula (strain Ellin514) TaxID=320771 RepID=B9XSF5_PEDPL|nr:sugar phosphate isomerase/epimerase family protein [Pedosphaera parvula]EEF57220.1 Xylose isomerase domain protein TIM barrel [Pedosphaera parvula Ellin514]
MFQISLAEWSLHRALESGKLDHMDFPKVARNDFGIHAIELVNTFFKAKAKDQDYLAEFRKRADDFGVKALLIMCDHEGNVGDAEPEARKNAIENHRKWLEAAKFLGCHSIRVNAYSSGTPEEQKEFVSEGLHTLSEAAAKLELSVLVENHGGLSSNAAWLASVIRKVNLPNCGTLPDFGNWKLADGTEYDRYQGLTELMPFAKSVSAKSRDFDASGNEAHSDYRRMVQIVLAAGYHGHLGIEYSGEQISEAEGILTTKRLLEIVRAEFSRNQVN